MKIVRADSADDVLAVKDLVKRFRHIVAVDDLSLRVAPGELVGFIGPNGAGKTTTMRCIAGQLMADVGEVLVDGVSVVRDPIAARGKIGYVPQELELYRYLTGVEFLRFVADIRGVPAGEQDARIDELLDLTELAGAGSRIIREYSGGMSRKIAIAAALIARPPLLLLDESFVGLDPESTVALRGYLARYCDAGGAVLISSHVLDMLERICTRVVVIAAAKVRRDLAGPQLEEALAGEGTLTEIYMKTTAPYRRRTP